MKLSMGPRGEGWFLLQLVFFALIFAAPKLWGVSFPPWVKLLGGALMLLGALFAFGGLFSLGRNLTPYPRPREGNALVTGGAYSLVRHPIYTGVLFGALGWSLVLESLPGLLLTAGLALLFEFKSRREEEWLVERHGDAYEAYRTRTKKLLPWLW